MTAQKPGRETMDFIIIIPEHTFISTAKAMKGVNTAKKPIIEPVAITFAPITAIMPEKAIHGSERSAYSKNGKNSNDINDGSQKQTYGNDSPEFLHPKINKNISRPCRTAENPVRANSQIEIFLLANRISSCEKIFRLMGKEKNSR